MRKAIHDNVAFCRKAAPKITNHLIRNRNEGHTAQIRERTITIRRSSSDYLTNRRVLQMLCKFIVSFGFPIPVDCA